MTALRKPTSDDEPTLTRIVDRVNALTQVDLQDLHAWDELRDLSSRTELEAIDTGWGNVVLDNDGNFEAVADVYVTLNYDSSVDEDSLSDSYLATIRGVVADGIVRIDSISIDVSSFYE